MISQIFTYDVIFLGNLIGSPVSNIIKGQGLESFFIKPTGCGEQTMSKLAPLVYVFNYLRNTKQVTKEIEESAFGHMQFGKSIALLSEIIQLDIKDIFYSIAFATLLHIF